MGDDPGSVSYTGNTLDYCKLSCLVPAHLNRMRIVSEDNNTYCSRKKQIINHILFECETFAIQRSIL